MEPSKPRSSFGRLLRSVFLGIADGVPVVSQVVTAIEHFGKRDTPPVGPRLIVGWSTVVLIGMILAARLWGGFGWEELTRLVTIFIAF